MHWATEREPIRPAELPYYNLQYLYGCAAPSDPTIVWGTDVPAEPVCQYVRRRNETGAVLVSTAHVLLQAVGRALARFPCLNCRVIRRRIYRFREINVRAITYDARRGEVDIILLKNADMMPLAQIARTLWKCQRKSAKQGSVEHRDRRLIRQAPNVALRLGIKAYLWLDRNIRLPSLRLYRVSNAPVLVNYLGFSGAPPMRGYKPSRFPDDSSHLSVTLGPVETRPVVRGGAVTGGQVAPLYVRGDHRITDAYLLGKFVNTLRELLMDPAAMEREEPAAHIPFSRPETKAA